MLDPGSDAPVLTLPAAPTDGPVGYVTLTVAPGDGPVPPNSGAVRAAVESGHNGEPT